MKHINFYEGRVSLRASYMQVGADLVVIVSGGDEAHVGAASLSGPGESHSVSFAHHREQELTQPMAEALALALRRKVLVVAGMHWRRFDADMLAEVRQAWQELTQELIEHLGTTVFNVLPGAAE